jgi:hypothetical protein
VGHENLKRALERIKSGNGFMVFGWEKDKKKFITLRIRTED